MEINVRTEQGITVVALVGELNAKTSPEVQERVREVAQPNCKVVLDMTGVPYMSSAGARMLLQVARTVGGASGRSVLVGLSPDIKNTLKIIGFLGFFEHRDNLAAGIAALNA
jgi:anti-sigma B factor antagonist